MRRAGKRLISAGSATLAAAVLTSGAVVAAFASDGVVDSAATLSTQAPARTPAAFRLTFDNGESLRPGTRVRDTTGHRHHARVLVSDGGRLTREDGVVRRAAGFPGTCRRCGRAILEINDDRALDPRRARFRFGAAVKVTAQQAPQGMDPNIVQKGLAGQPRGQFKLELLGSRPRCVISGRAGRVSTPRGPSIADGRWHQLQCARRGRVVNVRVDGVTVAQATGPIGRVANSAPVRIGGKAVGPAADNDQYHGDLDSVFLRINR